MEHAVIIVAGTVEFDPAQRDAALRAASELFAATRAQPGCLDYVWCADPASASRVWVYERWQDTPSLAAHLAGPCYHGMLAVLGRHGLRSADVAKHRVALREPVYDAAGKPRADFFTSGDAP
jgi:quinol monooxygenase YgiN